MAKVYKNGHHPLSTDLVSTNAKNVIETLQEAGFCAYIVGGAVRDLLLEMPPKDYDIATDAKPEEVRRVFKNSRIIGRRFRIVHVYFKRDIIEVSTFRANHDGVLASADAETKNGIITRDNVFGTLDSDAERRDLTINALYYDPIGNELWDHCTSLQDLKAKRVRIIGNPLDRFQEDPIRILRALRFSNKLGFKIEAKTKSAMTERMEGLSHIPAGRRFDEYTKLFLHGKAQANFEDLLKLKALKFLFPAISEQLKDKAFKSLINTALENTDKRLGEGKKVNPAFLIAVILWKKLQDLQHQLMTEDTSLTETQAFYQAIDAVMTEQIQFTAMPRRLNRTIKEIWSMQRALERRRPKQINRLLHHPRFRAAYDFLVMRSDFNGLKPELGDWWTQIQEAKTGAQAKMISELAQPPRRKKKKRKPKKVAEG